MDLEPHLEVAEDVSQLDMVACASPGWSDKYEIDKDEVVEQCVRNHAWVLKQLVQSQPAVIVFSGRSAFKMFNDLMGSHISPQVDIDQDVYGVLTDTVRRPHYFAMDETAEGLHVSFRARVVVSPHFSYDDNFVPHSRYSEQAWADFKAEHPDAVQELEARKRVRKPNRDKYTAVDVEGLGDFQARHPEAAVSLIRHFYEPNSMLADALKQEFTLGNLTFDRRRAKLERTPGPCRFCVNDRWTFPEGCRYGKTGEAPPAPGPVGMAAKALLD
jgi:hypothetical protein